MGSTCGRETLVGAVGAFGAGERTTVWTLSGTEVASRAEQRAGHSGGAPPGGAVTQAVEPRRTGITLFLA